MQPSGCTVAAEIEGVLHPPSSLIAALSGVIACATSTLSAQSTAVAQGKTINHVSLAVTDVEKSAAFYSKLLGLKEVSRPGNGGINLGLGGSFLGGFLGILAGVLLANIVFPEK